MRLACRVILATTLLILIGSVPSRAEPDVIQRDRQCELLGSAAEQSMKFRQERMPLADLLRSHHRAGSAQFAKILDGVAIRAYATPPFLTPELRVRAVAEFRATVLAECVKSGEKTLVQQDDLERIDAVVGEEGRAAFIHEAITKLLEAGER